MGFGDILKGAVTGFVGSGGNPWGAAAGALGGILGGGKSGGESGASMAAGAPTMTPDQQEISGIVKPQLKQWLSNPFRVGSQPLQQTKLTLGKKLAYTPGSVTQAPGSSGMFGAGAAPAQPATPGSGEKKDYIGSPGGAVGPFYQVTPGQITLPEPPVTRGREGTYQVLPDRAGGLEVGYDENYLKSLAEAGIDPLREAFNYALNSADAAAAAGNLMGSGFLYNEKFGPQPGGVARTFIDRSADVARDVALRGAEARREDQFRKAGMLSSQDVQDEINRQRWAEFLDRQGQTDYQNALGMAKYLADYENQNLAGNQALDLQLQEKNIGLNQDALANAIQFMYGLNPAASAANRNYWAGVNQQNLQDQSQADSLSNLFALGANLYGNRGGSNMGVSAPTMAPSGPVAPGPFSSMPLEQLPNWSGQKFGQPQIVLL
jgi:hypothetical protein